MKSLLLLLGLLSISLMQAQTRLTPKNLSIEKKWLKNANYEMKWFALKDTQRIEIGSVVTTINSLDNKLVVVTNITMKQSPSLWIDSTIANKKDLSPVYHSSYNAQRDMALKFGHVVNGFYNDKINKVRTVVTDTTNEDYFDSNLYPLLITWLPMQVGYKREISIYDYRPGGKKGVLKASIEEVIDGVYETKSAGSRNVWILKVADEISAPGGYSLYYIDKEDRRLWKQRIEMGGRQMEMLRVEE